MLDIGCANGYLLECLVRWGMEQELDITPHGLDLGEKLIGLAKDRLPDFSDNFHVGNVWEWQPPRRYDYVYMLWTACPNPIWQMAFDGCCETFSPLAVVSFLDPTEVAQGTRGHSI